MAPTTEVAGAPFVAQTSGAYSAGNPQEVPDSTEVIKAAPTLVYDGKWEPPVGRYHPRENDFAETMETSPPKPEATPQQEAAKEPVATPASQQEVPPNDMSPGTEVDGDDSVSVAPVATAQSSGNPYWKLLDCNIIDLAIAMHSVFEISESYLAGIHTRYSDPNFLRMRRYFSPKVDGTLKCSAEAMKMWKSPDGRVLAALGL